jgi:alkanesulfonate monooxygenase SsuD/methylene tetrahydromethanopterin reductase-like flavin-dependent oxidoreductase (luciferase family)
VTSRLRLGTGVSLLIQRDVIHTAKSVASLDLISGGRLLYAVSAGWNREEMRNHGTDPRTRGALLEERIQALRAIWTSDEASFSGEHVRFEPIFQWPKPTRVPPIYVGATAGSRRTAPAGSATAGCPTPYAIPHRFRRSLPCCRARSCR